jgi:spermidine synthase
MEDAPGREVVEPVVVERVSTDRGELVLRRVGAHHEVISNGVFLMDTRHGRSERLLVDTALGSHEDPDQVLIGGLGVGFSLVAALADPRVELVTVVEIEPALVAWHTSHLAAYSGHALEDPRVEVVVGDLAEHLGDAGGRYDVVCLDVDNGPDWTVTESNAWLYGDEGSALVVGSLRDWGVLAVWSAHASPAYEERLGLHLAEVHVIEVPVARGEPDVLYVGRNLG